MEIEGFICREIREGVKKVVLDLDEFEILLGHIKRFEIDWHNL